MGSSNSTTKDGRGDQEAEQETPAELQGCFLTRLISQSGRTSTSTPKLGAPPEVNTSDQVASSDMLTAPDRTIETEDVVAYPADNSTSNPTTTSSLSASQDQSHGGESAADERDETQEDMMVDAPEKKNTKKKRKKNQKAEKPSAAPQDALSGDQLPEDEVPAEEELNSSPNTGLRTTQFERHMTPILEEDEETPTEKADEPAESNTAAVQDTNDSSQISGHTPTQPAQGAAQPSATSEVFRFDNFHPETRCRDPECRKSTHPLDGSTKICPACGPRSKVRYCSKTCLYKDIRRHFRNECGRLSIEGEIDETSLDNANKPVRPYLRHGTEEMVNTVERHRQAVYFAMEEEGEYFIFDDVEECGSGSPTAEAVQDARGTGKCVYPVFIPDEITREYFRRSLMNALTWGTTNDGSTKHCEVLAGMVITDLKAHGEWDHQTCTYLCMQMGFEFRYQIPPDQQV